MQQKAGQEIYMLPFILTIDLVRIVTLLLYFSECPQLQYAVSLGRFLPCDLWTILPHIVCYRMLLVRGWVWYGSRLVWIRIYLILDLTLGSFDSSQFLTYYTPLAIDTSSGAS